MNKKYIFQYSCPRCRKDWTCDYLEYRNKYKVHPVICTECKETQIAYYSEEQRRKIISTCLYYRLDTNGSFTIQ